LIGACNFFGAHALFTRIHREYCARFVNINEANFRTCLLAMTVILDDPDSHIQYIENLEQWAGNHQLKGNLQVTLGTGRAQEIVKI
jgi:hypothetical protein